MERKTEMILCSRQTKELVFVWFDPTSISLTKEAFFDFQESGSLLELKDLNRYAALNESIFQSALQSDSIGYTIGFDRMDIYDAISAIQEEFGAESNGAVYFDTSKIELGLIRIFINPTVRCKYHPEFLLDKAANAVEAVLRCFKD